MDQDNKSTPSNQNNDSINMIVNGQEIKSSVINATDQHVQPVRVNRIFKVIIAALSAISIVCFLPLGIAAFVAAAAGFKAERQGQLKSQQRYLMVALILAILSIGLTIARIFTRWDGA